MFRFEFSIPDRNRLIPDRIIPFPISRNIGFVFPSGVPVPDKKIWLREWLRGFPDHSQPFSSLVISNIHYYTLKSPKSKVVGFEVPYNFCFSHTFRFRLQSNQNSLWIGCRLFSSVWEFWFKLSVFGIDSSLQLFGEKYLDYWKYWTIWQGGALYL